MATFTDRARTSRKGRCCDASLAVGSSCLDNVDIRGISVSIIAYCDQCDVITLEAGRETLMGSQQIPGFLIQYSAELCGNLLAIFVS